MQATCSHLLVFLCNSLELVCSSWINLRVLDVAHGHGVQQVKDEDNAKVDANLPTGGSRRQMKLTESSRHQFICMPLQQHEWHAGSQQLEQLTSIRCCSGYPRCR